MTRVDTDLIARHAAPVPRYTSYPTAPHFHPGVGIPEYVDLLETLGDATAMSLYLHIPYCHELCWYCGCNTKAIKRYDPVAKYLDALTREFTAVAALVPAPRLVGNMHWGGGSPNVLSATHIRALSDHLRRRFDIAPRAEFAVEIDPRTLSAPQVVAFTQAGVNRVSFGVQDFDPAVQTAINRQQPFEMTRRAVDQFRDRGVTSINVDIVYGLPHQTLATAERTLELVLRLSPDRIAAFGYAHLPSRLKHQRLIDTQALPGPVARFELAELIAKRMTAAGYVRIGLDHFARPNDPLAVANVSRNFQGYTTDRSSALLGIGASSIGRIGDTFVQNTTPSGEYIARVHERGLATAKGIALNLDDRMRAFVIETLMCRLAFSGDELKRRYGSAAEALLHEAEALVRADRDGLVERCPDGFIVTERGRPFVRSLCARFDSYLQPAVGKHSAGV